MKKWVYFFWEANASMKSLLGGKGANLGEMTRMGLLIPPGFIINTKACNYFLQNNDRFPPGMWSQTLAAIKKIETKTKKKFGGAPAPLLLSIRSGAVISMPGMMDTVINLGLNEKSLVEVIKLTDNPRFAYDAYRRLIQMFGKIVMNIEAEKFENEIEKIKKKQGIKNDTELTTANLQSLVAKFLSLYRQETGQNFPQDPYQQLVMVIKAVFHSWNGKRAIDYRNFHQIPHNLGTAVNIMSMVFGNLGFDSGTGVAFTRSPSTGDNQLYGEYLLNAQGEDVVAGIRTPKPVNQLAKEMNGIYCQLKKIAKKLESHYLDVQDLEFTIEKGKLWILQTRTGNRTAQAAIKVATDMVKEGLINEKTALRRIQPAQVEQMLHPTIDPRAKLIVFAKGLNASPGAATGQVVFDADQAERWTQKGKKVILVRPETSPDDVHGMIASQGILTARGGLTSHAAVVARGIGKPCVAGCEQITVDLVKKQIKVEKTIIKEGDIISLNGASGEAILGAAPLIEPKMTNELKTLLGFADKIRKLGVRVNADTARDARRGREFGAEGIGLCRTEHMFFKENNRRLVVKMIMARNKKTRQRYLNQLLPYQRRDFEAIFKAMANLPVIIRLIDPPMHEFLPSKEALVAEVAVLRARKEKTANLKRKEQALAMIKKMWEVNPMLGLRGCRTGIIHPEITEMQVKAIFQAACQTAKHGLRVKPEVMIPLVSHVNELKTEQRRLEKVAQAVMKKEGVKISYKFGTMIETPRAAITADQLAEIAQFFSFGTNDLTQMTFGFSRDDAEAKFLFVYLAKKILQENPFETIDQKGVGKLMKKACELGRRTKKDLELGICGEHGGDPRSIHFCHQLGLNYVSCSPFRVPIARLASAQACLAGRQAALVSGRSRRGRRNEKDDKIN